MSTIITSDKLGLEYSVPFPKEDMIEAGRIVSVSVRKNLICYLEEFIESEDEGTIQYYKEQYLALRLLTTIKEAEKEYKDVQIINNTNVSR